MVIEEKVADVFMDPKSGLNRLVGALLLGYCAPVLLFIAIVIRLESRDPVFQKTTRHSLNEGMVTLWRFRARRNGTTASGAETAENTALGRFLIRSRLERLPQLVNVARGEISIVTVLQ